MTALGLDDGERPSGRPVIMASLPKPLDEMTDAERETFVSKFAAAAVARIKS